ncbi:PDZ domain-containing protein [Aquibacillus sediminis]|uniref:PDZ domain-containing protein n=1 Tax=Aquibacillus sediminis TaxID=2574734 RepID=UPI001107A901|nr:PDZ domain-containing protein [Aquibacillus sediminis]
MEGWFLEVAKGIGKVFLHPLLYWFILLTILTSLTRIKQERKQFGTKVFDVFSEWHRTWSVSILSGLVLSVITIGIGFMLDPAVILLLAVITFLLTLTKRFTWLSAAYTFGFTYLLLLSVLPYIDESFDVQWLEPWKQGLFNFHFVSFAILLGLFVIIEAILLFRVTRQESFPELVKGNRGKWIGQHRVKKLAMIPFFTLVPGGAILPIADWWPVFQIDGQSYGLIVLPIVIGFEHVFRGALPTKFSRHLGQSVLLLGLLTLALAIAGMYVPILATVAVIVALVGREFISYRHRIIDQQKKPFFSPDPTGLFILGVIPGGPADILGLLPGEKINKVNGQTVHNEEQFYEALQLNSAFCKLDIIDDRGEVRFVQRAMYQGEHHELGLLFVKDQYRQEVENRKLD